MYPVQYCGAKLDTYRGEPHVCIMISVTLSAYNLECIGKAIQYAGESHYNSFNYFIMAFYKSNRINAIHLYYGSAQELPILLKEVTGSERDKCVEFIMRNNTIQRDLRRRFSCC